jgi:hypothetical protein
MSRQDSTERKAQSKAGNADALVRIEPEARKTLSLLTHAVRGRAPALSALNGLIKAQTRIALLEHSIASQRAEFLFQLFFPMMLDDHNAARR